MLPEQQQRIMGYFIEEAKDHLNTIEQGLLSLQATIEDTDKANEVFRAAHSVKGGAAMLGLESIQKTAHRMEDYFKVLKESPVQVDRILETMFLRISDGLKDLLEQLEGPFGLTQDKAQEIMADVEPVFEQLETHLNLLVENAGATVPRSVVEARHVSPEALRTSFKRDVPSLLRQMLTAFKQPDNAKTRQAVQSVCTQLMAIGEQFELSAWCDLIETARLASAHLENDYRMLAPVLIKEIKKAQDLVFLGRASEVSVCDAMQALLPEDILAIGLGGSSLEAPELEDISLEDVLEADALGAAAGDRTGLIAAESALEDQSSENADNLTLELDFDEIPSELATLNRKITPGERPDESMDALLATVTVTGPDVGKDELNSLADLFDGDLEELDNTLGGHAFASEEIQLDPHKIDLAADLTDLLAEEASEEMPLDNTSDDIEDDLFGGTLTDGEFATPDGNLDLVEIEIVDGLSSSSPPLHEVQIDSAQSNMAVDMAILSEDVWAEDESTHYSNDDRPDAEEVTRVVSAHFSDELDFDASNLDPSKLSALEDDLEDLSLDLEASLEEIDLSSLDSETALLNDVEDPAIEALGRPIKNSLKRDAALDDTPNTHESIAAAGETTVAPDTVAETVSPRNLDIEFPTLTGTKLQEAKEAIDSFFFDTHIGDESVKNIVEGSPTLELGELADDSREDDLLNTQLADAPWGELSVEEIPLEADLEGEYAELPSSSLPLSLDNNDDLNFDQAVSEFDELLKVPEDAGIAASVMVEPEGLESNLWTDTDLELDVVDEGALNADTALEIGSDLEIDLESKAVDDASGNAPEVAEDSAKLEASRSHKSFGEEISDEILAEFETAFGVSTASDARMKENESESSAITALSPDHDEEDDTFIGEERPNFNLVSNSNDDHPAADTSDETAFNISDFNLTLDRLFLENEPDAADDSLHFEQDSEVSEEESLAEAFDDDFDALDALLSEESATPAELDASGRPIGVETDKAPISPATLTPSESAGDDEDFGDLERLLEEGDTDVPAAPHRTLKRTARRSGGVRDQNMRVSVKHLDNLSNLVGELVVSRNTLERDQDRLRQFLDNLLFQVQQLNDVGQRMRDLYERSLLESSLVSNRRAHSAANDQGESADNVPRQATEHKNGHATGETFDALEMDRFTGFHTLSQEMIELIVRVRESSSDIGYTVESSDQVTRQFRQITTQLQEGLNTARMVAFSQAADRLPRAVRDISLKCGKEARLIVEGKDTLIDKMIVEHLYDPLTHLVNNAITHGVETPEARQAAGKPSEGLITVRAFYQGNQTVIYVADDGGGINTELVKRKAIEKQLISEAEAENLSDIETYDLLFHPGFSTRDQADDFAGRGVGMDVVRTSLAEIRGSVTIDSELGKGTSFTIRLPLTLSISKALSCVSNQARIAFPMDGVEDMLDVPRDRITQNEQGQNCVPWRDTLLTFQPLTDLLKFNRTLGRGRVYGGSQDDDVLSIIVLRSANTFVAVQVDQVIGEQEIVIKQLEGPVPKPLGIAGATVLGDGRVMPIADVLELIDIAVGRVRRESTSIMWAEADAVADAAPVKQEPTVLIVDDSITVRELLSMSFNKVGYRVEQARDGQEAWDKLRSGLPCDLVFCDIEMPRMDGLELLSRMQKDSHLNRIPIAMLTSRGADRHRQMAVDLGASGYFTKPYLEEALLDAAQRMLNGETLAKGRGG